MVAHMANDSDITIWDDYNETSESMPCAVDDCTNFRLPPHLDKFFEIELSTFQPVLGVPDSEVTNSPPSLWSPYSTTTDTDIDPLRALPDDIIFEILKHLRDSDIRSLRTVSRSWRQTFRSAVHQFPGCMQLPYRKALWISTLHTREGEIAFLSNNTCSRRKLYGKVFRFPESDIFPADTTMVASEAGLICIKVSSYSSRPDASAVPSQLESPSTLSSASNAMCKLIVCNPVLMDFRILPSIDSTLEEMPQPTTWRVTKFALMVDGYTFGYKVIVASADVNVRVFDSRSGVWKLGSAPPRGILFSGEKNVVTYRKCLYFVAYQREELAGSSFGKQWFIMRYNTEKDTWRQMPDVPKVHHINSWRICQHIELPDLAAMSDGLVLVVENDQNTNKHIFRFNKATRLWDLIFHVPIFSGHISRLGPVKCIGIQMNLYFLLPNSLPFFEVDIGSKQWAWCLPIGLYTEHDLRRFLDLITVNVTLPFEPSLHPASEPR